MTRVPGLASRELGLRCVGLSSCPLSKTRSRVGYCRVSVASTAKTKLCDLGAVEDFVLTLFESILETILSFGETLRLG